MLSDGFYRYWGFLGNFEKHVGPDLLLNELEICRGVAYLTEIKIMAHPEGHIYDLLVREREFRANIEAQVAKTDIPNAMYDIPNIVSTR